MKPHNRVRSLISVYCPRGPLFCTNMKTPEAVTLQDLPIFSHVPLEQLDWLVEKAEVVELLPGDLLFQKGDPADHMYVVMEGQLEVNLEQNGQVRTAFIFRRGDITGLLPFSRLTHASARGAASQHTHILALHRSHFPELEKSHSDLLQVLVNFMTDRVRDYTQKQQFNEKLMALGKLSAGLAHELNNPSAAIVRSSSELLRIHHSVPGKFKRIMLMKVEPEQIDRIVDFTFSKVENCNTTTLPLLERSRLEDTILEWLEEHQVEDAYTLAEIFVETGFNLQDLDLLKEILAGKHLDEVLQWVANTLSTERVICDIQAASQRIFELVSAVKTYSHMDRSADKQKVALQDGIRSTLTMLGHKMKEKGIQLREEYASDMPQVSVYPGELNQVWTNLIDNAIDAMHERGILEIKAWHEGGLAQVSITDNGPGIPPEVIGRIFDPFYTTKPIGKGTGLGLDIVNKIIQHHDAQVKVNSIPGSTQFLVQIPLA